MLKFIVALVLLAYYVEAKDLPKSLIPYKCRKDENFQKCFVESANKAIPIIAKGDPEYGFPNLMPMKLNLLQLISTPSLSLNFSDIEVHGLDKIKMIDIRLFWDKHMYTSIFTASNITINGNYKASGQVMIMPIKGSGRFTMVFKDATFKVTVVTDLVTRDGDEYYELKDIKLDYNFKGIHFDFENLFEGNKELGKQLNKFLNDNWDLLLTDFGPGIAKTVTDVISDIYVKVGNQVPMKNFFKT